DRRQRRDGRPAPRDSRAAGARSPGRRPAGSRRAVDALLVELEV
ncbi:MAG: hypothetical protein AVDCRST_MAG69-2851, partial [uncultured Solirubrobacteraceae bacterium]